VMLDFPKMQARQKHIDDLFRNFEKNHPTYGKYAN